MMQATQHKGVQDGISAEGIQLIRIHYSADPNKDPDTPKGTEWLATELQGYRGKTDPRWRKEMEIDFSAHGGQLLFPYLLEHEKAIFVRPYNIDGLRLAAGLDYGTRNPSAFEVLAKGNDQDIQVVWEYYEPPKRKDETDEAVRARKGYKSLTAAIKKCPYFDSKLPILADPSLWNKTQEAANSKEITSVAELFKQEGVILTPGQRGRDFACYERLDNDFWETPPNPKLTIFQNCEWLWWELKRLRFDEYTEATQVNRNLKEQIVDRDNHAWDAFKYVLNYLWNLGFFAGCDLG